MLSFDLTNATTMDTVWPFIANPAAIAVNQAWAGHPGREVSWAAAAVAAAAVPPPPSSLPTFSESLPGSAGGGPAAAAAPPPVPPPHTPSSVKLWAKPLSTDRVAVLVVNMAALGGASIGAVEVDLAAIAPTLPCVRKAAAACSASDVWLNSTAGKATADGKYTVRGLAPHDSAFVIFG